MAFHSPIEQFEVHAYSAPLFHLAGQPVAFTNAALSMILALVLGCSFMLLATRKKAVIPGRSQLLAEMLHTVIGGTLEEAAGVKAKPFLPFIFSIFFFILMCNILGLIPMVYTATSQLVVNFALAMTVIGTVLTVGFIKHGPKFLGIFVPKGVPGPLMPFLAALEFVSFFIRPCSLSLRLFANMLAGHILLKVFAGMTAAVATLGWAGASGIFPVIMNIIIVGFELFVAFLQAYIFTVLSSVYLRDALEMH